MLQISIFFMIFYFLFNERSMLWKQFTNLYCDQTLKNWENEKRKFGAGRRIWKGIQWFRAFPLWRSTSARTSQEDANRLIGGHEGMQEAFDNTGNDDAEIWWRPLFSRITSLARRNRAEPSEVRHVNTTNQAISGFSTADMEANVTNNSHSAESTACVIPMQEIIPKTT